MKKRSQSVNVKHRKISFGDFQTETIGISVKKILIEVPLSMKYSADDEMKKNDYVFNDLIKNKFYFKGSLVFSLFCLIIKIRS